MSWDYSVPDFYFDEEAMLDRKRQEKLQETYMLPTRTFWKPVYFDSYRESDILNEKFARRFRDYRKDNEEQKSARSLAYGDQDKPK